MNDLDFITTGRWGELQAAWLRDRIPEAELQAALVALRVRGRRLYPANVARSLRIALPSQQSLEIWWQEESPDARAARRGNNAAFLAWFRSPGRAAEVAQHGGSSFSAWRAKKEALRMEKEKSTSAPSGALGVTDDCSGRHPVTARAVTG